jgi:serine phosphatase RsbU (regulator of sigma subunit)
LVIGRSTSADLHVPDRFLSRRHARLYRDADQWFVEDLGSRNGSWLNGRRIDQPTLFRDGDRLRLSNTYLVSGSEKNTLESTPTDFLGPQSQVNFRPVQEISTADHPRPEAPAESSEIALAQARHLHLLNEIHRALSGPVDLDNLLETVLDCSFVALNPDQGVIYLQQGSGQIAGLEDFQRAAERYSSARANEHLHSETLLQKVASEGLTAHVHNLATDADWRDADSMLEQGIQSLIAAPLVDSQGTLGMIALTSKEDDSPFGDRELELLVSIASVASLRIRNMLLTEDAVRRSLEAEQIDRDLQLARQIQVRLLPSEIPQTDCFELHGCSMPSRRVSGDYYQIVSRREGEELLVMLADVAGKGLGASLLTASLEALAAGPIEVGRSPVEICRRVGRRLHERTISGRFASMFVGSLEVGRTAFTYANAGHCPGILICSNGTAQRLGATGPPLGLFPNSDYQEAERHLAPNDLLVLYSDGLTEAADSDENEYGIRRLIKVCRGHRSESLIDLAQAIEADIERFVRGHPYEDDRTLVLVRRAR